MSSAFCQESECLFGTSNLYELLGLQKENKKLSQAQIRKAYYRTSLKWHPDRAQEGDEKSVSTKKFQVLAKAYSVLSDKEKKAVYDETGIIDDDSDLFSNDDKDWMAYWRLLFKKVTREDIENFEQKYRESEEEKQDLIQAYSRFEGDMGKILETVPVCTYADEQRFSEILQDLIDSGEIPDFPKFSKEPEKKKKARLSKAKREEKEANKLLANQRIVHEEADESSLVAALQRNQQRRSDAFLDQLVEKYSSPKGKRAAKQTKGQGKRSRV